MSARSRIELQGLAVSCHIGVPEEERATLQTLWIDVELDLATSFSALQDDISCTVDYAVLATELEDLAALHPRQLIETLAADCVRHLLAYPQIQKARVRVRKTILPQTEFVAVVYEESRDR